jgi:hypothetical protein
VVGGHPLEAANGHRFSLVGCARLNPTPSTCGLAGAIASSTQHARKNIGNPIDHVGIGIAPLADQADVFGDGGVRRARILAVNDTVEILRIFDIGRLQATLLQGITWAIF